MTEASRSTAGGQPPIDLEAAEGLSGAHDQRLLFVEVGSEHHAVSAKLENRAGDKQHIGIGDRRIEDGRHLDPAVTRAKCSDRPVAAQRHRSRRQDCQLVGIDGEQVDFRRAFGEQPGRQCAPFGTRPRGR